MVRRMMLALAGLMIFVPSVAYCQISDTTPPVITDLTFAPAIVDVTSGPMQVTVTATITDDLAGVVASSFTFYSPSGKQYQSAGLSRISGTNLNGQYRGILTIPQYSESGQWYLYYVNVRDNANNSKNYFTAALTALGFPTNLTVISAPDTQPPTLTGISFSPSVIDVSNGPQNVDVTLSLTDDLAGVDLPNPGITYFAIYLLSPSGKQYKYASDEDFSRTSGIIVNGTWRATISIPQYSENGIWKLYSVDVYDKVKNELYMYGNQLNSFGVAIELTVQSVPSDIDAPKLVALDFSPALIDTSSQNQNVTVSFQATDDLSGVSSLSDTRSITFITGLYFRSPSGNQSVNAFLISWPQDIPPISGTNLNGVWRVTATFPRYSEAGTWKIYYLRLKDHASNSVTMNNAALAAAGFPTELIVTKPSLTPDGTIDPAVGGTVTDGTFGSRAALTVPPGVLTSPTTVSIDVLQNPGNIPTPQGYQGTGTQYVNFDLVPHPATPMPAPGISITIPLVSSNAPLPGSHLTLFRINPATGGLTPALGTNGFPIVGTVNADGLSATFTGIITLSTVVGLIQDPNILPGDLNLDGVVDCADLAIVKNAFGKKTGQTGYDYRADINRNGIVDLTDLMYITRLLPAGTTCK